MNNSKNETIDKLKEKEKENINKVKPNNDPVKPVNDQNKPNANVGGKNALA
jgi:hypothetical protein